MIGNAPDFIAYAAARGVAVSEEEAPVLLVQATDYMNTFAWVGKRPAGQDDSWPRTDITVNGDALYDEDGNVITVIEHSDGTETALEEGDVIGSPPVTPRSIIVATYRVALAIADGVDVMSASGGAKVTEERVEGAVTVKYADGSIYDPVKITGFPQLISDWLLSPPGSALNFPVMRG